VHAGSLVHRALLAPDVARRLTQASAVDVVAAGKAAAVMAGAFLESAMGPPAGRRPRTVLAIGPGQPDALPAEIEWIQAGHPLPTDGSVRGARRALDIAGGATPGDLLVVLLSGGGSALMALPVEGLTLADKQGTARTLMEQGADIYELNTVRKHISAIKGGQLAAASRGNVLTLAVSDVVGDDLSVIASGPTVADDSTFAAALEILARRGGVDRYPASVVDRLRTGVAGRVPETPSTGDPRLARSTARVIGPQRGAIEGARAAAERLGYTVRVIAEPITGEARVAAAAYVDRVARELASVPRPMCVIASGETTVTVRGTGKGGRNQEFAFAMAESIGTIGSSVAGASIGTDGIDGPTDAAGALVDPSSFARAAAAGISDPMRYLDNNDTYPFFDRLGDLVRTGPTSTNVGDIQIILIS
jgi:hydroxypyruvate reductase